MTKMAETEENSDTIFSALLMGKALYFAKELESITFICNHVKMSHNTIRVLKTNEEFHEVSLCLLE